MKKLLIIIAILVLPAFAWADPTAQGNFVVTVPILTFNQLSGDLYEDSDGESATQFGIGVGNYELGVQHFFMPNLAFGGLLGYSNAEQGDDKITIMRLGPLATYYFPAGNMIPYAGIGFLYMNMDYDATDTTVTTTSLVLKGGVSYPINQKLAAYGELSFSLDNSDTEIGSLSGDADGNTINIALGLKAFF